MMKKPFRTLLFCGLLCLLLSFVLTASADDLPTNYAKALKYVKKNQPMEAVASNIGWNPKQLTELKAAQCFISPANGTVSPFQMKARNWI